MHKVSLLIALEEQKFNAKIAEKQPVKQKEFLNEYMYSNPNEYEEMKKLYESYGYKYSRCLWALQQVAYNEADRVDCDD